MWRDFFVHPLESASACPIFQGIRPDATLEGCAKIAGFSN